MSDNIPFDIQMEVIKRVPDVKYLIRFRSVSKPWKSFIDSSKFISGYDTRDIQPLHLLLRYTDNVDTYEVKYASFVDGENNILTQQDFAPNVTDLVKHLKYPTVIGSSCGLWCLHGYKRWPTEMAVIWNPTIKKSVGIVLPHFLNGLPGRAPTTGFGVCPSTYDPTIVGISRCFLGKITWQVGFFTLSSKTWKMIPTNNVLPESVTFQFPAQLAIDMFIFWLAYDETVTIDEVNLPDSIANEVESDISISKLNESLVVSAYTYEVNGRVYGVWMMGEDGGVMTSFTKLFNINTPDDSPVRKVLGFTISGEPILETENEYEAFAKVEVYKPCSNDINDLGIIGKDNSFFICPRTETLLLVDHLDCSIISNDY